MIFACAHVLAPLYSGFSQTQYYTGAGHGPLFIYVNQI